MKIMQQLLNEVTLDALVDSTNDNFSDKTIRANESNRIHVNQLTYLTGNESSTDKNISDDPNLIKISTQLKNIKNRVNELTTQSRRWDAAVNLNKKSNVYNALKPELSDIFKRIRDINKIYPTSLLVSESLNLNEDVFDNIAAAVASGKKVGSDVAKGMSSIYQKIKEYAHQKKSDVIKQYDINKARKELNGIKKELDALYDVITQTLPQYKQLLSSKKPVSVTNNFLQIDADAESAGKHYNMSILFDDVQYHRTNASDLITIKDTSGELHYISPISSHTDTRVRCDCMDFRFRFAYANHQHKALIGQPQPYTKKPGSTRPPVNPAGYIGLCKHLIAFYKELKRNKIIV